MNQYRLTFTPFGKQPLTIVLTDGENHKSSIEKIIDSSDSVFSDLSYEARLDGCDLNSIQNVLFYVNDNYEQCVFSEGLIWFPAKGEFGDRKIFLDCYGYVELTIVIKCAGRDDIRLHSDYLAVLVRKGDLNDSVKAMADYVYKNQEELLYNCEPKPRDISGLKESEYKSLESYLILAEEVAMIYEISFGYFKANSRFKVEQKNVIDKFEKLQYVTAPTLQFIAQHPEQMKQVNESNGIRYRNRIYHIERTLTTQNIYSTDIYENRIIVGFLRTMVHNMQNMINEIVSLLSKLPKVESTSADYVYSSFYIFTGTQKVLNDSQKRLVTLRDKFEMLWGLYRKIIMVSDMEVISLPKPSAIFLSVPQYNKVFERINQWFSYGIYLFGKENYMLSFVKISSLYENYVLAKLVNYFHLNGFSLESKNKCIYPISDRWKYKNTSCINTFIFSNEEQKVTLYYQPVIFDTDKSYINNIGLYRNNTISLSDEEEGERRGHYYVPDFLIKIERADIAKYIICDAKFSELKTIHNYYITALAYKYLFSLSTISYTDMIAGLCIIYGQCINENTLQSVYDRQLSNQRILPFAETLPLLENINEDKHFVHIMQVVNKI